jgi:rifampin ADP-ribosylating transferase
LVVSAAWAVSVAAEFSTFNSAAPMSAHDVPTPLKAPHDAGSPLYHGTRADLKPGDLISAGYASNYGGRKKANHVYFSGTLEAATWGAELAEGEGRGRIYIVEPTGPFVDDPNLTDKKFPGNPTKSYRSKEPVRITGEVADWTGHPPEQLKAMKDNVARRKQLGTAVIDD